MLTADPLVLGNDAIDAMKTYLRIDGSADDATLLVLSEAAVARCEAFVGDLLIERDVSETLDVGCGWGVLGATPVKSITRVATALDDIALASTSYAVDLDSNGRGKLRVTAAMSQNLRVSYRAGRVSGYSALPEPLQTGIVRLVAHDFTFRDRSDDPGPPAAVLALWRGARRMRLK